MIGPCRGDGVDDFFGADDPEHVEAAEGVEGDEAGGADGRRGRGGRAVIEGRRDR